MTHRASAARVFTPHPAGLFNKRAPFWIGDTAQLIVKQRRAEYATKKEQQLARRRKRALAKKTATEQR